MDMPSWFLVPPALAVIAGIVLLSFVSEDAATFSSALLVLGGPIAWPLGFLGCFVGIWVGDVGLYALARCFKRPILRNRWCARAVSAQVLARCENQIQRSGIAALFLSRFIPGTRLPTYLAAGFLAMPLARFAWVTGLGALVWIGGVFGLTKLLGAHALVIFSVAENKIAPVVLTALAVIGAVLMFRGVVAGVGDPGIEEASGPRARRDRRARLQFLRCTRWEFWPAWLFYIPVVAYYLLLSLRYRSFTLPTAANPAIPSGGMIGESKIAILDALRAGSGEFVADAYAISGRTASDRLLSLHRLLREHSIPLPFILKPDVGQRGNGVKLIRSIRQALEYFHTVRSPLIVQRYAPGPDEVGIFYYRFPGEARGRIFSLTEKIFPSITGDGIRTIAELIAADPRASLIAGKYLRRFAARRAEILARGATLKLVESGNHAQGCIFRDGGRLATPELLATIDGISRGLPGFFIGRYDVRYESEEDLQAGRNFQIVELNGAASEATHIYDARNSLRSAYGTLFEQWRLVFAIGAANRACGLRSTSLLTLWREWRRYSVTAAALPVAD